MVDKKTAAMVEKDEVMLRNRMSCDDYGYVRKNLLCTFGTYYQDLPWGQSEGWYIVVKESPYSSAKPSLNQR